MTGSPKIAIVGTGANGASIGADMVRAGADVTFIEQWPAHVEAMRADGLTVHLPDETQVTPVKALHLCEVAELSGAFDIVFTSVKTYDTRWVCELVKPVINERSLVVGLQNGMTIDAMGEILGADRTGGSVLGIAANMFEPGIVVRQYAPAETWIAVGTLDGERTERIEQAAEALAHTAVVELTGDIRGAKWMKLIANIPEMLPSAILNVPLLTAVEVPGVREVMDEMTREAFALATDLGIPMQPIFGKTLDDVQQSENYAISLLDAVLEHYSRPDTRVAVLQEWAKGRRAELDAFSGYIVDKRRELGGRAPVNEAVLRIAQRIEAGEIAPAPANSALLIEAGTAAVR